MTDIVERLRTVATRDRMSADALTHLLEAADEIVRLRADVANLEAYITAHRKNANRWAEDARRLRALITEWAEATAAGAFEPILDSAYRERMSRARRALREEASK